MNQKTRTNRYNLESGETYGKDPAPRKPEKPNKPPPTPEPRLIQPEHDTTKETNPVQKPNIAKKQDAKTPHYGPNSVGRSCSCFFVIFSFLLLCSTGIPSYTLCLIKSCYVINDLSTNTLSYNIVDTSSLTRV